MTKRFAWEDWGKRKLWCLIIVVIFMKLGETKRWVRGKVYDFTGDNFEIRK